MSQVNAKQADQSEGFAQALKHATQERWLGNQKVVDGLLRTFSHQILTDPETSWPKVKEASLKLAEVFLGKDPKYPGPAWNSPGQIDAWVGHREGVDSEVPEERIAGGLVNLVVELGELGKTVQDKKLISEQWRGEASDILQKYVRVFMGIPLGGGGAGEARAPAPANKLPRKG